MKRLVILLTLAMPVVANAQFNDLLKSVKGAVDSVTNSAQKPSTPAPANTPASTKAANTTGACGEGEKLIFSCKVKGESLNYCYADQGGAHSLEGKTKLDGKAVSFIAHDLRDSGEKPPYANVQETPSNVDGRDQFTTVYITEKDNTTYAVTQCGGMRCGILADQPWFTVYKGTKKILNSACDEGSVTIQSFNYKLNNKGKVINDGLYQEKKTKLDFNPPE